MARRCRGTLTAYSTIFYLLVAYHGTSVSAAEADCRQLCADEDRGATEVASVTRCVLSCMRLARLTTKNQQLWAQEKLDEDPEESVIRANRGWFFPRWQSRITSGIGSRSRAAGSYLRIGRRSIETSAPSQGARATDGPPTVDRRGWRRRPAGRYLRIGRADETLDTNDGPAGNDEAVVDMSHLRKVNRDAGVEHDGLQQLQ